MTTDCGSLHGIALGVALLAGCGGARFEVARLPPDIRRAYDVFEVRCSKCHALGRPLDARIESMEHWTSYVGRMRRMPGSGISGEDAVEILRFLEYYTYEVRGIPRPEAPEPTAEGEARDE